MTKGGHPTPPDAPASQATHFQAPQGDQDAISSPFSSFIEQVLAEHPLCVAPFSARGTVEHDADDIPVLVGLTV